MTRHTIFILAATLLILAVLFALPAQAQDTTEPPISATVSRTLYLPALLNGWHAWFTDSELDAAMRTAGYDPAVASMHTNCYLDPSSTPPAVIRYASCKQYLIGTTPTEGTGHYIWYVRLGDNVVHGLEVGQ